MCACHGVEKGGRTAFSDAAGACVGVRYSTEPVYVICRCSMRVRVRRAHARRTAPCNQIARMAPQRRRWGLCGCTHATQRPCICHLSMQHACVSAEGPRTTNGAVQSNRTYGASATPLGPVWAYARYPTTMHMSFVDAACVCECGGPTHGRWKRPCLQTAHMTI
jgi:hypothetical protein